MIEIDSEKPIWLESPYKSTYRIAIVLFIIILFSIIIGHNIIPHSNGFLRALFDSILIVTVVSPLLYLFIFKPIFLYINQKHLAEDALLKSDLKTKSIMESIPDMLFMINKDAVFMEFKTAKGMEPLIPAQSFLGKKVSEVLPPRLAEEIIKHIENVLMTGNAIIFEYKLPQKDTIHEFEAKISRINENEVLGIVSDITDRKHNEELLRCSEARLSSFMNSATEAFTIWDSDLNLVELNTVASNYLPRGVMKSDVIGRNIMILEPDVKSSGRYDQFLNVIKTGEPLTFDILKLQLYFDNVVTDKYLNVKAFKVSDGLGLISTDITEQKHLNEKLIQSEEKYHLLYESSPDAIMLLDENGFIDCNNATLQIFGFSNKEDFIKLHPSQVSPPSQPDGVDSSTAAYNKISEAFKKGLNHFEWAYRKKNEKNFFADVLLSDFIFKGKQVLQATVRDISEQKQVEDKLRQQNDFIKNVIDSFPYPLYVINIRDHTIEMANSIISVIGEGATCYAVSHNNTSPCENQEHICPLEKMKLTKKPTMVEHLHYDINGNPINLEVHCYPIFDHEGNMNQAIEYSIDITERKKAEGEYKTILHTSMDGFYTVDTLGRILDINDSYCNMIGYSRDELLKMSIKDLDALETEEIVAQRISQIMRTGEIRFETKHKCKNGKLIELEASVKYLKESGKFFAFMRDITQRKQAEKALLESKVLVDAVIENVPLMIFLKEAKDLRFVIFNKAGEELLGYDRKDLLGKNNLDLFPPEQAAYFMAKDREVLEGELGILDIPQEPIMTAKKGERLLHTLKVCIRGYDGVTKYLLGISEDITEQKRTNELMLENERLEIASRTKSEFLAAMSHELRTPLNAIIGFSDIMTLGIGGDLNETQKNYVSDIYNAGNHLLTIIDDILDLSKVEAGKMELVIEKFSIHELLEETHTLIKNKAIKHNIDIIKNIDPELEFIEGDKHRIKQVIFNLLSNSIKFSKEGGGTIKISIKKEGEMACFSVSDTGIGIEKKNMDKLFNEFQQLDSGITRKYGGTGLGLVISKKLVELHGGNINVESIIGEGSTFTFSIPIKQGEIR